MRTVETEIYQYDELSDDAKERARDWWRNLESQDWHGSEYVIEDAERVAAILGVTFDTRAVRLMGGGTRTESQIYWSGFYSQGDGASFTGSYAYAKGAPKAIRAYAPEDKVLHAIADKLQATQRKAFYCLTARISRGPGSNFYSHSGTMAVEAEDSRGFDMSAIDTLTGDIAIAMVCFADWIYCRLRDAYESDMSDDNVAENIVINEYEFTEDGKPA